MIFSAIEQTCKECGQLAWHRDDVYKGSATYFDRETIEDTEIGGWMHIFSPHRCVKGNDEA